MYEEYSEENMLTKVPKAVTAIMEQYQSNGIKPTPVKIMT